MIISQMLLLLCALVLVGMFIYNVRSQLYLDAAVIPLLALSISYVIAALLEAESLLPLLSALGGSVVIGLPLLIVWIKTKGKMIGFGDTKLGFIIGMLLGFKAALICLGFLVLLSLLFRVIAKTPKLKKYAGKNISSAAFWVVAILLSLVSLQFV